MVKEAPGPDGSWGPRVLLAPPGGEGPAPLHRGVLLWDGPPGVFLG